MYAHQMMSPTTRTAAMKLTAQSFMTPHIKNARKLPPRAAAANSQPKLFPPLVLPFAVNASQTAPPVALLSVMLQLLTDTVPLAFDRVARVPGVLAVIVTKLPAVPLTLKLVTVCVPDDGKTNAVG